MILFSSLFSKTDPGCLLREVKRLIINNLMFANKEACCLETFQLQDFFYLAID